MLKDYKQIWNELSATSDDAAYFVGFLSEEEDIRRNGALTVEIRRGTKLVERRRFAHAGTRIHRVRLPARGTRRGD